MKITIKALIFFWTFLSFGQSTNIKITYNVNVEKERVGKPNSEFSRSKNKALTLLQNADSVNAYLLINKNKALYTVDNKMKNDKQKNINFIYFRAGGKAKYYTDTEKKYNIFQTNMTGEFLRVSNTPKEWLLTKESKKIGNFLCYKAILKTNTLVTAWYTTQIPLQHGPLGYNNLPGLVLELHLNKYYWISRKIEFNHPESKTILEPKNGKLITEAEFKKISAKAFGGL